MSAPQLPTDIITRLQRTLQAAVASERSPFTFAGQTYDWGGRAWSYSVDVAALPGASAKSLSAFLAKLGGPATVFTMEDPTIENAGAGTVTVSGGLQTGDTLTTTGWTTAPDVGDFFSLGTGADARLYQITQVQGGLPTLTLTIVPDLRLSPSDGQAVEITAPLVALRMRGPVPAAIDAPGLVRASFEAIEAL